MAGMTILARSGRVLAGMSTVLAIFALWEILAQLHVFSAYLLPDFFVVLRRMLRDTLSGELPVGLALTIYRALAAFALAGFIGVAIGIMIARIGAMRWFFDPLVSIGLPMPKIAFLPVFILWFGVFDKSKILLAAFSAVFPVIVAAAAATENVDKYMMWSAQGLGASDRRLLWEVALPAAFPQIMTGLQIALPIALIVAVLAEMAMGGEGLGGDMMKTMRFADSPGVFSNMLAIAFAGSALVKAMELIRRRLLIWHTEAEAA